MVEGQQIQAVQPLICPEMSKPVVKQTFPRSLAVLTVNCSREKCGKWKICAGKKDILADTQN